MLKRFLKLIIGCTLASFSITCVLKADLGCFAVTSANVAFSNWFPVTIGLAGFCVEFLIMLVLLYLREGIGITGIMNMTFGSLMIDVFNAILPSTPFLLLFLPLLGVAWALIGQAGFGDTNSNLLTTAIMKRTGKKIGVIRGVQECTFLSIGILGSNCVTFFTLFLSLFLGYMLQFIYKLMGYNPTEIEHKYLIKRH